MDGLKQASPSPEAQAADLAAANAAIAKATKLNEDALAGRDVPQPYSGVAHWSKLAGQATAPDTAELFRRVAKDQLARYQATIAMTRTHWAEGLSDPARRYAYKIVSLDGCGVDEANTAWFKIVLKTHGWFTIGKDGKDADTAAFLLVQHADRDPAFQAEVLPMLEKLALEGQARPANYALLFDRVAHAQKRPQRYGSQGRCNDTGVWEPFETEDPATLDQRRATMGLPPEADYAASISARACKRG
ncbi:MULTISPECIES: DUF6624 domain-containing protein [unclassified Caulobacter]|uniref:DUF6624 domain-containing protein n=1 Tax=unclassified Caulobacter TaxID=2648921 RepID=UPI0006F385A9|nr:MULTISPECIES: DUF6624 domain-containing protein [unclassified Caulobacter]KQV57836.1 hypothetical protein ASC62_16585 [Caulobacter sp. Root342]KQV67408.1 hypothetical protein ASC70_16685 [Caulobacter sp. Root343]